MLISASVKVVGAPAGRSVSAGTAAGAEGPGLFLIIPIVDRIMRGPAVAPLDMPRGIITKDNAGQGDLWPTRA